MEEYNAVRINRNGEDVAKIKLTFLNELIIALDRSRRLYNRKMRMRCNMCENTFKDTYTLAEHFMNNHITFVDGEGLFVNDAVNIICNLHITFFLKDKVEKATPAPTLPAKKKKLKSLKSYSARREKAPLYQVFEYGMSDWDN